MLLSMIECVFALIYMLLGAVDIYMAINRFKEKRYFFCGLWCMGAVYTATFLVKLILFK